MRKAHIYGSVLGKTAELLKYAYVNDIFTIQVEGDTVTDIKKTYDAQTDKTIEYTPQILNICPECNTAQIQRSGLIGNHCECGQICCKKGRPHYPVD